MPVLLSFISDNDPFISDVDNAPAGPILRSLQALEILGICISRVYLFTTPQTEHLAEVCKKEIARRHGQINQSNDIDIIKLSDLSSSRYADLFRLLSEEWKRLFPSGRSVLKYVNPYAHDQRIHGCWLTLIASGQIQAELVEIPPNSLKIFSPLITKLGQFRSHDLRDKIAPTARIESIQPLLQSLDIVGEHSDFIAAAERVRKLTKQDTTILFEGESSTGRSTLAELSHLLSERYRFPLKIIDCKTLPRNTPYFAEACPIERQGKNTLLLRDVDHLNKDEQLRLCEWLTSEKLPSRTDSSSNVRILATAGPHLQDKVTSGDFAESLYYQFPSSVELPALRDRKSDIPILAQNILEQWNQQHRAQYKLSSGALKHLSNRNWKGNLSELQFVLTQSLQGATGNEIDESMLSVAPSLIYEFPPFDGNFCLKHELDSARKMVILHAMKQTKGVKKEAAKLLGVTPPALSNFEMDEANPIDNR